MGAWIEISRERPVLSRSSLLPAGVRGLKHTYAAGLCHFYGLHPAGVRGLKCTILMCPSCSPRWERGLKFKGSGVAELVGWLLPTVGVRIEIHCAPEAEAPGDGCSSHGERGLKS